MRTRVWNTGRIQRCQYTKRWTAWHRGLFFISCCTWKWRLKRVVLATKNSDYYGSTDKNKNKFCVVSTRATQYRRHGAISIDTWQKNSKRKRRAWMRAMHHQRWSQSGWEWELRFGVRVKGGLGTHVPRLSPSFWGPLSISAISVGGGGSPPTENIMLAIRFALYGYLQMAPTLAVVLQCSVLYPLLTSQMMFDTIALNSEKKRSQLDTASPFELGEVTVAHTSRRDRPRKKEQNVLYGNIAWRFFYYCGPSLQL